MNAQQARLLLETELKFYKLQFDVRVDRYLQRNGLLNIALENVDSEVLKTTNLALRGILRSVDKPG